MNNLYCDTYLEWVRRCERDGWAVISIARNAHFEKPVVLGDAILSGRRELSWKLFCEMVLLFGTLLRFVIFFIDIFLDCCIFDNNIYHKCLFFYLICTFSCVNLRFCFRCLHLRSLTSPFPLQTELQICGAMLKLL